MTIGLKGKEDHESSLKRNNGEADLQDVGELVDRYSDLWGIICEKGVPRGSNAFSSYHPAQEAPQAGP